MNALYISYTEDTPEINFNPAENLFKISHRSLPENAIEFYQPIFKWLNDYIDNEPNKKSIFDFKLEYFNTASAKQIAQLLLILERLTEKSEVLVRWHYDKEDTDMLSSGKRYQKLIKVKFEFVSH